MSTRPKAADLDFDEFYAARALQMRRVAFLVVRDWQLAEDVVQSAFIKAYLRWRYIRAQTAEQYIRRVVVNTAISTLRKQRGEITTDVPPDTVAVEEPLLLDACRMLDDLTAVQRAVVALRFLDDQPVAEVARLLGISEGTVKSHTSRALANLRNQTPTPSS